MSEDDWQREGTAHSVATSLKRYDVEGYAVHDTRQHCVDHVNEKRTHLHRSTSPLLQECEARPKNMHSAARSTARCSATQPRVKTMRIFQTSDTVHAVGLLKHCQSQPATSPQPLKLQQHKLSMCATLYCAGAPHLRAIRFVATAAAAAPSILQDPRLGAGTILSWRSRCHLQRRWQAALRQLSPTAGLLRLCVCWLHMFCLDNVLGLSDELDVLASRPAARSRCEALRQLGRWHVQA